MGKPFPGHWTFDWHPWLRAMHDSTAPKNVGKKAAQMGFTETVLNYTFFSIDVKRVDCLYVLPNKTPDASDFSSARFDAALELSPHLQSLFSDVKNVGHKRAGSVNLYVRGSRGRGGMKSVPAGLMVLDEFDEMDHAQVVLATERLSGQLEKVLWEISTPTFPNWGIDKEFQESTQEHYFFKCPSCSRFIELTQESLVVTAESINDPKIHNSYYQCTLCKNKLLQEQKRFIFKESGTWKSICPAGQTDQDIRGFFIPQFYSSTIKPVEMARSYIRAQQDPTDEQEYFNSKLGLARVVKGAQITDEEINTSIRDYTQMSHAPAGSFNTLGIDVGTWLHCVVISWKLPDKLGKDINTFSHAQVLKITKVLNFEDLDQLMHDYQIRACVIDMFPERRKAKEFADRFFGFIRLCFYGRAVHGKLISVKGDQDVIEDHQITVDRTSWLDTSLGRFKSNRIILPKDISQEFKDHIKSPARVYEKDADGNPTGRYESIGGADHYAHALNYAEIALPMAAAIVSSSNVEAFL